MTLFPELKDDFTAENGVTYTWEDNRWRVKAYRGAGGNTVYIGENPPADAADGDQWFCSAEDSLQMFLLYQGQWIPSSPCNCLFLLS